MLAIRGFLTYCLAIGGLYLGFCVAFLIVLPPLDSDRTTAMGDGGLLFLAVFALAVLALIYYGKS